jgi:hypothetical protein
VHFGHGHAQDNEIVKVTSPNGHDIARSDLRFGSRHVSGGLDAPAQG